MLGRVREDQNKKKWSDSPSLEPVDHSSGRARLRAEFDLQRIDPTRGDFFQASTINHYLLLFSSLGCALKQFNIRPEALFRVQMMDPKIYVGFD
jgi:hypothetical protein